MSKQTGLAVIIPANNEADYIGPCLDALLNQLDASPFLLVVSANACTDRTVEIAQSYTSAFASEGHDLHIIDALESGKPASLNRAEALIEDLDKSDASRVYLDADVICGAELLRKVETSLATQDPRYATGRLVVARASSFFTRAYSAFWQGLPFIQSGTVGAGFFAVNQSGRARWGAFPTIISDDTFVRLSFAPTERVEVDATYIWPMIEGFRALTRVRRRQDDGVRELASLHPEMLSNEGKSRVTVLGLAALSIRLPIGFLAYMSVHVATRIGRGSSQWTRGR